MSVILESLVEHSNPCDSDEYDEIVVAMLKSRFYKNYRTCGSHVDFVLNEMAIRDVLGESTSSEAHRKAIELCLSKYNVTGDAIGFIRDMTSSGSMTLKESCSAWELTRSLKAIDSAEIEIHKLKVANKLDDKESKYLIDHHKELRETAIQHLMAITLITER